MTNPSVEAANQNPNHAPPCLNQGVPNHSKLQALRSKICTLDPLISRIQQAKSLGSEISLSEKDLDYEDAVAMLAQDLIKLAEACEGIWLLAASAHPDFFLPILCSHPPSARRDYSNQHKGKVMSIPREVCVWGWGTVLSKLSAKARMATMSKSKEKLGTLFAAD
jgi:hypothetical protein